MKIAYSASQRGEQKQKYFEVINKYENCFTMALFYNYWSGASGFIRNLDTRKRLTTTITSKEIEHSPVTSDRIHIAQTPTFQKIRSCLGGEMSQPEVVVPA